MSRTPNGELRHHASIIAMLELTVAGALWGFGFVAATWALRGMGPLAITGWRFAIAAALGLLIAFRSVKSRQQIKWNQFRLAAFPGLLLCATLVLQTWGLKTTTATKSAFITTLYVLFVPLSEKYLLRRKLPPFHLHFVLIAFAGVILICDLRGEIPGLGDCLTLLCAIAATFHILLFGIISQRIESSFVFNTFQSVWAGVVPFFIALFLEPTPHPSWKDQSAYGLLALAFGSTMIAFALQVRAQKKIPPSLASLFFLLESPFSAVFAFMFLGETLSARQWFGGGLILFAALASCVLAKRVEAAGGFDAQ